MSFGLKYEQLRPAAGAVRAGVVSYDGSKPGHEAALRAALPRFLGPVGAVHGAEFPVENIEAVIGMANAKEIEIDFLVVAVEACGPVMVAGLATGGSTFGVEWDENNKFRIVPIKHGEDLCVDPDIAKLFRERTRSPQYPDGIGAGTWFVREQIRRSIGNSDWVSAGRDNEHSPHNLPIIGLMDKFGATRGTEHDSAVLQLDGQTQDIKPRWRVPVITEDLPARANSSEICPHNFLTRWSSDDGQQQLAVIYRKMPSTFGDQTVVWTKIFSNGYLPDGKILQDVLASLLLAGCEEMSSPKRKWGVPREKLIAKDAFSCAFGGTASLLHIPVSKQPKIVGALLQIKATHRKFGNDHMVSGVIYLKNMSDPETILGQKLPEATQVAAIDPDRDANMPYFGFGPAPIRPLMNRAPDNDNVTLLVA